MRTFSVMRSLLVLAALAGICVTVSRAAAVAEGLFADIETPRGTIVCQLDYDRAPLPVASFVGLAEGKLGPEPRKPFFDGLTFHRVVPGFVIQGGDPKGTGEGGPGYTFPDQFAHGLSHDAAGVLSMANNGPDTNGSQFFLTLRDVRRLDYLHSVFGRVIKGLEVLPTIQQGDKMTVKIRRVGAAAQAFRADEEAARAIATQVPRYAAFPAAKPEPGPEAHFDSAPGLLPTEPPRAATFNFKLANLERATGLRIVARLVAKSPTEAEDKVPGAYMRALAQKLGTAQRGALAVYFADESEWRVWIGDELAFAFVGKPGTASELTKSGAIHEVKETFLKQAAATGDADFEAQKKSSAADKQPPANQRLKLQTDAILDGLIAKLGPKG